MLKSKNSPGRRVLFLLILSLLAMLALSPNQGVADGNGGLPVGGLAPSDTVPPPAPQEPSDPAIDINSLTIILTTTLAVI